MNGRNIAMAITIPVLLSAALYYWLSANRDAMDAAIHGRFRRELAECRAMGGEAWVNTMNRGNWYLERCTGVK